METLTADNMINRRVWGPWATIGFGLLVGIVLLITQVLTGVFFIATKIIADSSIDPAQLVEDLVSNGLVLSLATIISTIVCVGLLVIIIVLRKGAPIVEYLALKSVTKKALLLMLTLSLGLLILTESVSRFSDRPPSDFMPDLYSSSVWPALLWIALIIFTPILEEVFFRGFLLIGLKQSRLGSAGAVILISLIWTSLHIQYDIFDMTTIFIMGIILGAVRLKTGSLWVPLLMHALWNLVAVWQVAATLAL